MNLLLAFFLSLLPFTELRLAIPLALASKLNPFATLAVCVLGNIAVIIPIFLFLDYLHSKLLRFNWYMKASNFFLKKILKSSGKIKRSIHKYGFIVLTIFVAIPLPMTGAWTGSIIAWLLGLKRKKSFVAIALGVLLAGIIVMLTTLGIIKLFKF